MKSPLYKTEFNIMNSKNSSDKNVRSFQENSMVTSLDSFFTGYICYFWGVGRPKAPTRFLIYIHPRSLTSQLAPEKNGGWKTILSYRAGNFFCISIQGHHCANRSTHGTSMVNRLLMLGCWLWLVSKAVPGKPQEIAPSTSIGHHQGTTMAKSAVLSVGPPRRGAPHGWTIISHDLNPNRFTNSPQMLGQF